MLSPFHAPLRLDAFDAPHWVLCLLVAVAVTATAVVAGHRHVGAADAHASAADSHAAAAVAASASVSREAPVSRSGSRSTRAEALARAGALTRQRQAAKAQHRRTLERRADRRAHRRVLERRAHRRAVERTERARAARLPVAPSDAGETVAAARRSSVNAPGRCLEWSREQAGIPSKYADAATAWRHASGRRPADPNPPRGAAVYWVGGSRGYGHIAISLGNGTVRSSDAGGSGQVGTIPINRLTSEWNLQYAGWANSINGYRIPGVRA